MCCVTWLSFDYLAPMWSLRRKSRKLHLFQSVEQRGHSPPKWRTDGQMNRCSISNRELSSPNSIRTEPISIKQTFGQVTGEFDLQLDNCCNYEIGHVVWQVVYLRIVWYSIVTSSMDTGRVSLSDCWQLRAVSSRRRNTVGEVDRRRRSRSLVPTWHRVQELCYCAHLRRTHVCNRTWRRHSLHTVRPRDWGYQPDFHLTLACFRSCLVASSQYLSICKPGF